MREMSRALVPADAAFRPEQVRYFARPGVPAGTGATLGFLAPQLALFAWLLWAIWWPAPDEPGEWELAVAFTGGLLAMNAFVAWALARYAGPMLLGVVRAPFIRVTVTDRRILWELPWRAEPLFQIEGRRILDAHPGDVDRRGRGNAAILLVPGDFAADVDGCVHIDKLPQVARFVTAVRALAGA